MALSDKWKRTVDDGVTNKAWDDYDATIKAELTDYNTRLKDTPGFVTLDPKWFKAIIWVESGGPGSPLWKKRVMQIGNKGDQGLAVLRGGKETAKLIMSAQLAKDVQGDVDKPELNVRAGMAYVLTRMVTSDVRSVDDPTDTKEYEYTVAAGDSFDKIADPKKKKTAVPTTVASLEKLNPSAKMLKPGQKLKYRKASVQRVITGWKSFSSATVAKAYNGGGDEDYEAKLDYVLDLFTKLKR